jgi:hypothetical protein
MRTGITVHLSPIDRKRLRAVIDDRNSSQKGAVTLSAK